MRTAQMDPERERYQQYLCSREWSVLKEAVKRRCGGICERCKHYQMNHVHHLTYIRKYQELLEDLQAQCMPCHEYTHGKRDRDPILDAPITVLGVAVSGVYFAGRMNRKSDWRNDIAEDWKIGHSTPSSISIPDGRSLSYRGPFWVDLWGHGMDGLGPHAAADDGSQDHCGSQWSITNPAGVCNDRFMELVRSELMFAWLDSRECFGTIAEIGAFRGLQYYSETNQAKRLVVAMPKWDRELWFACAMADGFIIAPNARKAWHDMWNKKFIQLGEVEDTFYSWSEEDQAT